MYRIARLRSYLLRAYPLARNSSRALSHTRKVSPLVTAQWLSNYCDGRSFASEASPSSQRMTDLSGLGPKRFYDKVTTQPYPPEDPKEHAVLLDGKPVKTPRGGILATPMEQLSTTLAAEWDAQEGRIRPSSMPLTSLISTARDIVPESRERVIDGVLKFIHTDAVCLRPDTPKELVEAQDKACQAVLEILSQSGAKFVVTRGALAAEQDETVVGWARAQAEALNDYSLAALEAACGCAKSTVVGLALWKGVEVEQALAAARAEERWQTRVWGVVEGGHDLDEADIEVRLRAADLVFRFVEQEPAAFRRTGLD